MNMAARVVAESSDQTCKPRHIAIVTDAWSPQINGVVRTLETTIRVLRRSGHRVSVISPDDYRSVPCPSYPEIRLALTLPGTVSRALIRLAPDAVHIATEGPLGLAARRHCTRRKIPFSTAYHTQFPEYLARRTHLPAAAFWPYIRWFHGPAERVMVATETIAEQLRSGGISGLHRWSRGVDLAQFHSGVVPAPELEGLQRPIMLYVGRIAVEKNIEAFLNCDVRGSKVLVGDGPAKVDLERRYPDVIFAGPRIGSALAGFYTGADVLVFPSLTDTFGLVMIEAMACGTPVAAYPVAGPIDIVTDQSGALSNQLDRAIAAALTCSRRECADYGATFTWEHATAQFVAGLQNLAES